MTLQEAKDHFGSYTKVAAKLGVTKGAVSQWKASGVIPEDRQLDLHRITKGRLKADRHILTKYREILRAA
jgi:DNA-binding transcriptional regulator YdaS (Cro superfamily)